MIEPEHVPDLVRDELLEVARSVHRPRVELDVGLGEMTVVVVPVRRHGEEVLVLEQIVGERDAVLPILPRLRAVDHAGRREREIRVVNRGPLRERARDDALHLRLRRDHAAVDRVAQRERGALPRHRHGHAVQLIGQPRGRPGRQRQGDENESQEESSEHLHSAECNGQTTAIKSISTLAPFGSEATPTVERAGL